jgi:hypothetical protein
MDTSTAPRTTEVGAQGGVADAPSWPALAAWGGGLIQLALGAGAITGAGEVPAIRAAGILLAVIGVVAIGWGAATLARGRIVVPRLGIAGSLAGILAAAGTMALDPARVSVFAVAAACALLIAVALGCALAVRRAARPPRPRTSVPTPSPLAADASSGAAGRVGTAGGRRLVGLFISAVLVAGVVTPALAATEAGQHAVPHGEMVEPGHH